ncbi:MAG TPA: sulfotransferase [Bacteroidia bacterium]|nr:sulfotransferase [Bacteroidia bacterium]
MTLAEAEKINQTPIMFIMGKERSGTTLLQAMLNSHPNIVAPIESRIIIFLYARYGHVTDWTEKIIDRLCTDIYNETRFALYWNIERSILFSTLVSVKSVLTYPLVCKIIYCQTNTNKEIKLIFDKNPVYYFFMKELTEIFPDAKYIHIVRDYRDNITSHQKVMRDKNTAELAYRWLEVNKCLEERKEKFLTNWHTVKYESLVTQPIDIMTKVCSFIDVPFYENMVTGFSTVLAPAFYKNADRENFTKFHWNVFNPVNNNRVGQWKVSMPKDQVEIVEAIDGEYGKRIYGYEITLPYKKPNSLRMFRAKFGYEFFKRSIRIVYANPVLFRFFSKVIKPLVSR